MKKVTVFYRCDKCKNVVALVSAGAGEMSCCGQPMTLLSANSVDAATEKHVPVVEAQKDGLRVQIGEVPHPMLEEHYIEWIAAVDGDGISLTYLNPGDKPEAFIREHAGSEVYEYCNLHGLWKTTL